MLKTLIRRAALVLGGLVLFLALFCLEENARGRRAWKHWKASQEASGQSYDPAPLVPRAVPADQNFAEAPFLRLGREARDPWYERWNALVQPEPGDWRRGVPADFTPVEAHRHDGRLDAWLSRYGPDLDQLADAARRPASRMTPAPGEFILAPRSGLDSVNRPLQFRALVRLHAGDAAAALEDILTGLRIGRHLSLEPGLWNQTTHSSILDKMLQPIWEGLRSRAWSAPELARLQAALAQVDLVASQRLGWRGERCMTDGRLQMLAGTTPAPDDSWMPWWERMIWRLKVHLLPGWIYQYWTAFDQDCAQVQAALDPQAHRVDAGRVRLVMAGAQRSWRKFLGRWMGGNETVKVGFVPYMALTQAGVDQARVACALERWRLARNRYPDHLSELVPAFLPQAPNDLLTGGPLHYASTGQGYQLYAVGWSGQDQGGKINPDPNADDQGDWVWFSPR